MRIWLFQPTPGPSPLVGALKQACPGWVLQSWTKPDMLNASGGRGPDLLVIACSEPEHARTATLMAREILVDPAILVITRQTETAPLEQAGADEVLAWSQVWDQTDRVALLEVAVRSALRQRRSLHCREEMRRFESVVQQTRETQQHIRAWLNELAHDLRTPLTPAILDADSVSGPHGERLRRNLQRLGSAVEGFVTQAVTAAHDRGRTMHTSLAGLVRTVAPKGMAVTGDAGAAVDPDLLNGTLRTFCVQEARVHIASEGGTAILQWSGSPFRGRPRDQVVGDGPWQEALAATAWHGGRLEWKEGPVLHLPFVPGSMQAVVHPNSK